VSDAPEDTGPEREAVGPGKPPREHQFKPGNPGRPKGSRNKLGEAFLTDLLEDWQENGKAAIAQTRTEKPAEYVKVVASILPKQVEIREDLFDGLSDEQLAAIIALADREAESIADAGAANGEEPAAGVSPLH